jgi:hypothetical protein
MSSHHHLSNGSHYFGGGRAQVRNVTLCTAAPFYAPYRLLLISNKFWMGGRGGSQRGRSEGAESEGENKKGGGRSRATVKLLYVPAPPPPQYAGMHM